jgi:Ca2+-binding EF-hand superfamily protein
VFKNNPEIGEEVLEEMIAEADEVGNGEIGLNEFNALMLQI